MKQFYFVRSTILITFFFLGGILSCVDSGSPDSEDPQPILPPPGETVADGGVVSTYQIVSIPYEGTFSENQKGKFNGHDVDLWDDEEQGMLNFVVNPAHAHIGEGNILDVPSLELKIKYNVIETQLGQPAPEVLKPYFQYITEPNDESGDEGAQAFLEGFAAYYEALSEDDLQEMARFVASNEGLFNHALMGGANARLPGLNQCQTHIFLMGTFVVISVGTSAQMPIASILSGAMAIRQFVKARTQCADILSRKLVNSLVMFQELIASARIDVENLRVVDGKLIFTSGEAETIPVIVGMRGLQESDSQSENVDIASVFELLAELNTLIVEKLNVAIAFYNSYAPAYFSMTPIDPVLAPQTATTDEQPLTNWLFESLSFSLEGEGVTLGEVAFTGRGGISMTLDLDDPEAKEPVEATLRYVFTDEYNNTEGSFPVVVEPGVTEAERVSILVADGQSANLIGLEGKVQLTARVEPEDASQDVIWSIAESSSQGVAVINESGLVTPLKYGMVTVRATAKNNPNVYDELYVTIDREGAVAVTVSAPVSEVEGIGNTVQLTAVISPEEADQRVEWVIVSGQSNATVSDDGLLTAIAYGEVTVRATSVANGDVSGEITMVIKEGTPTPLTKDAAVVREILSINGISVADPRWESTEESELIKILRESTSLVYVENGRITWLHIDAKKLTKLPESIGNLAGLTRLSFNNNELVSVPEGILNLTNLTELIFSGNKIREIPRNIDVLVNLTTLSFERNELSQIPETIGNLVNLTVLYLRINQLKGVPESISNLKNLNVLGLGSNQLTSVPGSIGSLKALTGLDLSRNKLTQLPASIGNLTNLIGLDLDSNQLTSIPNSFGALVNLESINFRSNSDLKCLPSSVWGLKANGTNLIYEYTGIAKEGDTDCSE